MSDRTPKRVKDWLHKHDFYFSNLETKKDDGNWCVSLNELISKLQEVDDAVTGEVFAELEYNDGNEFSFWRYRKETPEEVAKRNRTSRQRRVTRIKQLERELKELKEGL